MSAGDPPAPAGRPPVPAGRPPVPAGWRLRPAEGLGVFDGGQTLVGGFPLRVLTLSSRGAHLVAGWLAGQPVEEDRNARELARRLLDAGLADPDPPGGGRSTAEVTIVVPVYSDAYRLARALAPLAADATVIVVDDGSPDGDAIASVAEHNGASYVRLAENRGASAARNAGLELASTPLVAFLDADCLPPARFPDKLVDHLADPAVALVAPRVVSAAAGPGPIAAYERSHSALDMGPRASPVRPYSAVWYVPSAAMVARRDALGAGFDEHLRLGEDVDLVWRLHDAGWQLRYDPRITVAHEARVRPAAWYRRRVAYNESVAQLLSRHPERVPVLFLTPRAALAWAAALAGQPGPLLALAGVRARRLRRELRGRVPHAGASSARISAEITVREGRDLARALAGPWAPFAVALVLAAPRGRRRRALARRVCGLLAAMAAGDWFADRPDLDPLRYAALRLADESTRGLGIWLGCARERDFRGLLPRRPPPPGRR
ncbi:MAG TPA: mycofactocin biosynthesis glycosyltransferase MftF [Solirubrobacteraceae bacterium]|nr:mycofactocin biosynthesis glycosyltransferase MftF [Solirubrobacteraceae bacterium]